MSEFDDEQDELPDVLQGVVPWFGADEADEDDEGDEDYCDCGQDHGGPELAAPPLPLFRPVPPQVLSGLAAEAPLVRRAVALATWLGSGRPVGVDERLAPADVAAVVALGLADRLLPGAPGEQPDGPRVEALWDAARAAGLIGVADGTARAGSALSVWRDDDVAPEDRVEAWAALLAGYLRAVGPAGPDAAHDHGTRDGEDDEERRAGLLLGLPVALYVMAREPATVGMLASALLPPDGYQDDDEGFTALLDLPPLTELVAAALEVWAVAGALAVVPEEEAVPDEDSPYAELEILFTGPGADQTPQARKLHRTLRPVFAAGRRGPSVRLTPLGSYGLARLLVVNGVEVPMLGECSDLGPAELLDRLVGYDEEDLLVEATVWIEAREESWESDLRDVALAAAGRDVEACGRRAVLPGVLAVTGPRVVPLLDALADEPMLAVAFARTRHLLELGPELTPRQELWDAVDVLALTLVIPGAIEGTVRDTGLPDLLREVLAEPDGAAALRAVDHPAAKDVLWAALPHLGDGELARRVRGALGGGVASVRRAPAGRGGPGRKRRAGKRR